MRSYRFTKHVAIALFLVLAVIVALWPGFAAAQEGDDIAIHCTLGEAMSAFQAYVPGIMLVRSLEVDEAGLAEGIGLCQYRLFIGLFVDEVCFCEHDVFLGGTNILFDHEPPDGISEAREWLQDYESQVTLISVEGDVMWLDMLRTAIKNGPQSNSGEHWVYQQHGVILQLPPGDYVSRYEDFHPDYGEDVFTVRVRVLPHDIAHDFGPAPSPIDGSVVCPPPSTIY